MDKIKTLIAIMLLIYSNGLLGQTITGSLISTWDDRPMYGCTINSNNKMIGMVQKDGKFTISKTDDIKEIVFAFVGFHTIKIDVANISKDKDLGTVYMCLVPPPTDLKRGTLTETYDDGKINTSISIKGNLPNGAYTKYYQNGKKQIEGHYYKGQQSGLWLYYKQDGQVINFSFENGLQQIKLD